MGINSFYTLNFESWSTRIQTASHEGTPSCHICVLWHRLNELMQFFLSFFFRLFIVNVNMENLLTKLNGLGCLCRYRDEDDDTGGMETSFSKLEAEEKRSYRLGLKEDREEELKEEQRKKQKMLMKKGYR